MREVLMTIRRLQIAAFFSGFAALLYELIWIRQFSLVFGATSLSLSCAIAAFMAGLCAGYLISYFFFGPIHRLPLFPLVELATGLSAGASIYLLSQLGDSIHVGSGALGNFGITLVFLLLPTLLMGMSLPFLIKLAPPSWAPARVYAINTLGGAAGALASYTIFFYYFGFLQTSWIALAANLVAAALVIGIPEIRKTQAPAQTETPAFPILLALAGGFLTLVLEQCIFRLGEFLLGRRVYVHSLLLSAILVGLYLSAELTASTRSQQWRDRLKDGLLGSIGTIVLFIALWPYAQYRTVFLETPWYKYVSSFHLLVVSLIIFLPIVALSALFPFALRSSDNDREFRNIPLLFFVNTAGAVLGSLGTTYFLFPRVGVFSTLKLVTVVLGILTIALARKNFVSFVAFGACVWVVFHPASPRIGKPPLFSHEDSYGYTEITPLPGSREALFHQYESIAAVYNKPETEYLQQSLVTLPIILGASPKQTLIVGMGYGLTSGAFVKMELPDAQVDTVELVPAVILSQSFFPKNMRFFEKPGQHIFQADGRTFLAHSNRKWSLISVNVTSPYAAGATSVYSEEFYRLVVQHLEPGGIYSQLFFGGPHDLSCMITTLKSVFPHVIFVAGYKDDGVIALASFDPLPSWQSEQVHARWPLVSKAYPLLRNGKEIRGVDDLADLQDEAKRWLHHLPQCRYPAVRDSKMQLELSRLSWHDLFEIGPDDYD